MSALSPLTAEELCDAISQAGRAGDRLEIRGGGSKAAFGRSRDARLLDMRGFAGIVDYDPNELVLTVRAGTPLAEVAALVAARGQQLAFEPWDYGPFHQGELGRATIGGAVAAGVAGPQRLTMGSARDHLLGFTAVSGRGELFTAGARVVKNVTGYDLPKLLAGSWGRLAAITELTLKVLPAPRKRATMAMEGLDHRQAVAAMADALGSPAEIAAAAHIPARFGKGAALTLFRLQGFEPSVDARCNLLPVLLAEYGAAALLDPDMAETLWRDVREGSVFDPAVPLWRINVPPSGAISVIESLEPLGARWVMDWAGGLVWLELDSHVADVRASAEAAGGHATLVRASAEMRESVSAQHPRAPSVAAIEARVRQAFDPLGVFETGRFMDRPDAD